jgi:signal transduction histidine kinase
VHDTETVDLAELSETCWQNVESSDASLRADVERTVEADRSRLAQLLENLLRNAVEHGGDDVEIRIGDLSDGLFIADDGPGVPADERDAVFEWGYSTRKDGTGFGLSIVKTVAETHGWTITVTESAEGGARFELTGVSGS